MFCYQARISLWKLLCNNRQKVNKRAVTHIKTRYVLGLSDTPLLTRHEIIGRTISHKKIGVSRFVDECDSPKNET